MAKVLVLLAPGFEEVEAVTIVDVLRRAEVSVTLAALFDGSKVVRGSHDIAVEADELFSRVDTSVFDAIALPGGMPGAKHLREDARVLALLRSLAESGKLVAAICAAPTALEAAGLLASKRATSFPGHALPSAQYVEERVVVDGKLVTSRGPGTAFEFALELVAQLTSPEVAARTREKLLLPE